MEEEIAGASPRRDGLKQGLVWNLVSAILPQLGAFLVGVILFPYLGPTLTGYYGIALTTATVVLIVGKFGVQTAASRLVSENEEHPGPWIHAALRVRTLFTLPAALLMLVLSPFVARGLEGPELVEPFWLVAAVVVAASYFELGGEILVGLRRFPALLATRFSFLLLRIAAVVVVRLGGLGVTAFLVGHTLAQALPAGLLWVSLLRSHAGCESSDEKRAAARRVYSISLPLALSSASFLIFAQTDKLMLAVLRDAETVGQYLVARNVLDAALFPTFAVVWTLRPGLIRALVAGDDGLARHRLAEGLRLSVIYAFGAGSLMFLFGPGLVRGFFGADFIPAMGLLRWMVPILMLRGLGTIISPALLAADEQASYAKLMVWAAAINIVANLVLIPPMGAEGAIVATFLSLIPLSVGGFAKVKKALGHLPAADHLISHAVALGLGILFFVLGRIFLPSEMGMVWLLGGAAVGTLIFAAGTLPLGRFGRQ